MARQPDAGPQQSAWLRWVPAVVAGAAILWGSWSWFALHTNTVTDSSTSNNGATAGSPGHRWGRFYPEATASWEPLGSGYNRYPPPNPSWRPWRRALYHHMSEYGAIDVLESTDDLFTPEGDRVEGGWRGDETESGTCQAWALAGFQHRQLKGRGTRQRIAKAMAKEYPHIGNAFASAVLVDVNPLLLMESGVSTAGTGLSLSLIDHRILTEIFQSYPGGASGVLGSQFCDSAIVLCTAVDGELRVTGLRFIPLASERLGPVVCSDDRPGAGHTAGNYSFDGLRIEIDSFNPATLPTRASGFAMLRTLEFHPLAAMTNRVSGDATCAFLESLLQLEVLVLSNVNLPASCTLRHLKAIHVTGVALLVGGEYHSEAVALPTTGSTAIDDLLFANVRMFGQPVSADSLRFVCNSPGLLQLQSGRIAGLPPCMGRNTELRRLDLRGGRLHEPLPIELATLTKLVDFVAFEQSARDVPLTENPNNVCKLAWAAIADLESIELAPDGSLEEVDGDRGVSNLVHSFQTPWHCTSDGWSPRFDDPKSPWWAWRNIERFWVDVNFFHGTIPSWLPDKWPQMRTLDLYSNELTGTVPWTLCRLSQLDTLQIQDNHFTGAFPFEAFFGGGCHETAEPARLKRLTLSVNNDLEGCITAKALEMSTLEILTVNYTRIRVVNNAAECHRP